MTITGLKACGKLPVERQRLISVVIGGSKAGRHALRSLVGIESRVQVASEEE